MVIYKIENKITGDFYIGRALNFKRRISNHTSRMNKGISHCVILQNAWNKYGATNFEFSIIEQVTDISKIIEREQYYLDTLQPKYNASKSAQGCIGLKRSIESIEKTAEASRKSVLQFSINGELIKEWGSLTQCSNELCLAISKISSCCNGKRKSTGGYCFQFKDNAIQYKQLHTQEEVTQILTEKSSKNHTVVKPDGTIEVIRNLKQYCAENGLNYNSLIRVGRGERNHHKGYKIIR